MKSGNASMPDIQRCVFAVADTPYCVWGRDLSDRNLRFLDGVDADYFIYIAETHLGHIEGEHAQRASVALRAAYHLSLETFFSLIAGVAGSRLGGRVGFEGTNRTSQGRGRGLRRQRMPFPMKWKVDSPVFGFAEIAKGGPPVRTMVSE